MEGKSLIRGEVLPTGCAALDSLLGGGVKRGEVVLAFGERGAGKTSLVFQTATSTASSGSGSVIVYSDGRFPLRRLSEISGEDWQQMSERIWVVEVRSFEEQDSVIEQLETSLPQGTAFLAIDSATGMYRAELGEYDENIVANKILNRQLAVVKDLAVRKELAVLITSEVRDVPDGSGVMPVASAILTHWSDRVIRLERIHGEVRKACLLKPPPRRETLIRLTSRGFSGMGTGND
ncbi:MAG: ATPase domain-containing protein [Candidatus Methanosuratincola sp.]